MLTTMGSEEREGLTAKTTTSTRFPRRLTYLNQRPGDFVQWTSMECDNIGVLNNAHLDLNEDM